VILTTVLVQGSTLGLVIRATGVDGVVDAAAPMTIAHAEAALARARLSEIEKRAHDAKGRLIHPRMLEQYQRIAAQTDNYAADVDGHVGHINAHFDLVLAAVAAARTELVRLHRAHQIDDETLHSLERDLDLEELGAMAAKA
jgi:CPA1 family monovalent cation:H+ antiporter